MELVLTDLIYVFQGLNNEVHRRVDFKELREYLRENPSLSSE